MKSKAEILEEFSLFSMPTEGLGAGYHAWNRRTLMSVFERLGKIDELPLSPVQLNQLLVMGHEAPGGGRIFSEILLAASAQGASL